MIFPLGFPLMNRSHLETKENSKSVPLESVRGRLLVCVITEFVLKFKQGFIKAAVSRAVRLQKSVC